MIRFYAPDIEETGILGESDSGHCCRVLRMKEGDLVYVVDGKGNAFECVITDAHPKHTRLDVRNKTVEHKFWRERIVLAVAPTKNIERIEWLLEKAVEIGVDEIVLLKCSRSERKIVNEERLEKIMVSAMKQSLKATLPKFYGLLKYGDFVKSVDTALRYVGYCDDCVERKSFALDYPGNQDLTIMIGPEGDFTSDEIAEAFSNGFNAVTFGESRLRTESAALYSLTAVHVIDEINRK